MFDRSPRAALALALSAGILSTGLPIAGWAADEADDDRPDWAATTLSGDWGGARTRLSDAGISVGLTYIGEVQDNVSGGVTRGALAEGRLELFADFDLEKLAGWPGATIHANAFDLQGRGATTHKVGNLLDVSNIAATHTTRLFTLWLQQELLDDALSIRLGQLAADDEFLVSETSATFMNGTFGWAGIMSANLPSGGPAFPLAAPGVRVQVAPSDDLTVLAAAFAGDPAGIGTDAAQRRNHHGTTFSLDGGTFYIGEVQYAINRGEDAAGLPGVVKLGAWYHLGDFADQRFDTAGRSLADPNSNGTAANNRGNYGIYGVVDQRVWQESDSEDRGLNLFMRAGGVPADRNQIDLYVDGGAAYKGLIPGRDQDVLGLAMSYARISGDASDRDEDARRFNSTPSPVRDFEAVVELTYVAQITPYWTLQPDIQYVVHPGGNIANPKNPTGGTASIADALVLGLRTTLKF